MPIQNFHEDFLGHKIEACNVQQGGLYILRFNVDCHKWEFVPYGAVVGGVDIMDEGVLVAPVATCINFIGDYVQAQLVGGCVNVTISQPSCYPAPLSFDPLTNILYTNQGNACESSITISTLLTNTTIIADITDPTNRVGGVYTGPIDPTTCLGQWYYDAVTGIHYQFNGGIWYQIDSSIRSDLDLWLDLTGSYASASTFTFTGTAADALKITRSIFRCEDSGDTTIRKGYIKSASESGGTVTATVVTDSDLASGDKNFKITPNRKIEDYKHLITIPGECVADASNPQGMRYRTVVASYMLPVNSMVKTAAAGTGAALTWNVYDDTGALFSSAPDMTTNTTLDEQRPTTVTEIAAGSIVSLRITSSAGATNKASDFQAEIFLIPTSLLTSV